ncbi:MAG: AEC family transporter [Desulfobacteraceae bacterium]|nr:AEC family transporter [Desulfobacteraceae bacterium]
MEILSTIIPIFIIVILGWVARKKGFIPEAFLGPANRLVYYLAIPAMIFRAISKSSLGTQFQGAVLLITLFSAAMAYFLAFLICRFRHLPNSRRGTFIQSAGHGNLGYIGLAVAFYFLGDSGLVRAGIIAGFLMILQNLLSVIALQAYASEKDDAFNKTAVIKKIFANPVILSALAGIGSSALQIPIPVIILRSLDILSGLALPTALLLIGASISLHLMRSYWRVVTGAIFIKLFILPGIGFLLFNLLSVDAVDYLPGLILLAAPTATIAYVMGREMQGDTDFAVAAISASTLLSALSISIWLSLAG